MSHMLQQILPACRSCLCLWKAVFQDPYASSLYQHPYKPFQPPGKISAAVRPITLDCDQAEFSFKAAEDTKHIEHSVACESPCALFAGIFER